MQQASPAGRREPLSVGRIVGAAIAIADAEGLEAVSMRRIAAELGSGTMSLYRHVADKDTLHALMADRVIGEEPPPFPLPSEGGPGAASPAAAAPGAVPWREGLRAMAVSTRRTLLAHPWAGPLLASRPGLGPAAMRRRERMLGLVDGLGLSIDEMAGLVRVVTAYVRGVVVTELAEAAVARRSGAGEEEWRRAVGPRARRLVAEGRLPLTARLLAEAADAPDPDRLFLTGLETVLDGVGARIAHLTRHRPAS